MVDHLLELGGRLDALLHLKVRKATQVSGGAENVEAELVRLGRTQLIDRFRSVAVLQLFSRTDHRDVDFLRESLQWIILIQTVGQALCSGDIAARGKGESGQRRRYAPRIRG